MVTHRMGMTEEQRAAIEAGGNVLVMAGAGTGKTTTLVGRCLKALSAAPRAVSLDRVLLVTFTEAAAAEMRWRLRDELERISANRPEDGWWEEQLALLGTAQICTLHSFCLRLVREHFHELGLDPQLRVLDEREARLLEGETLEALLASHYAGDTPESQAVQQLVLDQGQGWDGPVRDLVRRVHHYTQTLANAEGWFERELAVFERERPAHWEDWLSEGFNEWRALWSARLRTQPQHCQTARACAQILEQFGPAPTRRQMADALEALAAAGLNRTSGKEPSWSKAIEALSTETKFLRGLIASPLLKDTNASPDLFSLASGAAVPVEEPLAQDWRWVRGPMSALLRLARRFGAQFARAKRDEGAVDFHDLEQFALKLLWDREHCQPTAAAQQWRTKLELVLVDEYQDINQAQDTILRALGREDAASNRFLVGDVKQSIYRFRLADPRIFQSYAEDWSDGAAGQVKPLAENWRSAEAILTFVNALFEGLMRREVGGVEYDESARLRYGDPATRRLLRATTAGPARVELHLNLTGRVADAAGEDAMDAPIDASSEAGNGLVELTNAEHEAWRVAGRLRELKETGFQVWDKARQQLRPVSYADMAVLLRSPRNKADVYARVFEAAGLPLAVVRSGFLQAQEVVDLLSLLEVLDNPLQDLPLLAVLRSPLAGLSLDELALVRLASREGWFWTALRRFTHQPRASVGVDDDPALSALLAPARSKVARFLEQFERWRELARRAALSECLEAVLDETFYEAWLEAQSRGTQRLGNVRRLLNLTRQFDQFQRQGLFRFLSYVRAQQQAELDLEPAAMLEEEAIRLMSIHQSKGLEFPVVVLADLGKRFNFDELNQRVILDEKYGLCPQVKPPQCGQRYPSLPYWLARQRQRREILGEEIRLLYVACTRARDLLLLAGTASRKTVQNRWPAEACHRLSPHQILSANSCLDWLGRWLPAITGHRDWTASGQCPPLAWRVYAPEDPRPRPAVLPRTSGGPAGRPTPVKDEKLGQLSRRLEWSYPYEAATRQVAKASVSELQRQARASTEEEEGQPWFRFNIHDSSRDGEPPSQDSESMLTPLEIGTAHHTFLQWLRLDQCARLEQLQAEAQRLRQAGTLTAGEAEALDLRALAAFWQSDLGQRMRAQAEHVHRELRFTFRLSAADLAWLELPRAPGLREDEWLIVQGVIDLALIRSNEMWILDFKTNRITERELEEASRHYRPQLQLYGLALERIWGRPVSNLWLHFLALDRTVQVPSLPRARAGA